jgi:hypothetical protein
VLYWPRRWSIHLDLLLVIVGFVIIAGIGAFYSRHRTLNDARSAALRDVASVAAVSARDVEATIVQVQATVARRAAGASIADNFLHPSACKLTFSSSGLIDGYLNLIRPDGSVACSSRPDTATMAPAFAGAAWLSPALQGPTVFGPYADPIALEPVVVVATPVPGGVVRALVLHGNWFERSLHRNRRL